MMKAKDVSIATALIIHGFLRANEGEASIDKSKNAKEMLDAPLVEAIAAIRQECGDWAENLASENQAVNPETIAVILREPNGGDVARSAFNLVSAAISLLAEASDVGGGPEAIERVRTYLDAQP